MFDIILEGELLRDTLGEALVAKNVSTESAVVLEYTLLAVPPKLSHSTPQTDWCAFLSLLSLPHHRAGVIYSLASAPPLLAASQSRYT